MKPDILSKLKYELDRPIRAERQVVYILVEIRKLLEVRARNLKRANKPKDFTYATLEFCCDWAVHPVMDWENGRRIVRRFNLYEQFCHQLKSAEDGQAVNVPEPEFLQELNDIIALATFRIQLKQFLKALRLSTAIAANDNRWNTFLGYYAGVIEDCPLKCCEEGLEYADEVTVKLIHSKHKPLTADIPLELTIQWEWVSKKTRHVCCQQFIV